MKKILVSAFDPFGGESVNPAWESVKLLPDSINGVTIIKVQIPTVFYKSVDVLLDAAKKYRPDIIVSIGQAGGRFEITLERVGINIDDARIKDNEGNQPLDTPIYKDGASAYFSSLPIKSIMVKLRANGVPCTVSNTAGTFVCNHIMYSLLYHIEKHGIAKKGGFIHVPFIPEQVTEKPAQPSMTTELIVKGLSLALEAVIETDLDIMVSSGAEH